MKVKWSLRHTVVMNTLNLFIAKDKMVYDIYTNQPGAVDIYIPEMNKSWDLFMAENKGSLPTGSDLVN